MNQLDCPHCRSQDFVKGGNDNGRQRYICKSCGRKFSENYKTSRIKPSSNVPCPHCQSRNISKRGSQSERKKYFCKDCCKKFYDIYREEFPLKTRNACLKKKSFCFNDDVWFIESLGVSLDEIEPSNRLDISKIKQPWLKALAKRQIQFEANGGAASGTLIYMPYVFTKFSEYVDTCVDIQCMEELTRDILLDFFNTIRLGGISSNQYHKILKVLRKFIDNGNLNGWFKLPEHLIRKEDYPKFTRGTSNDIPKLVLDQIENNLHKLLDPIARMWIIGIFCGMRISELRLCPLDCLKQDARGNWSITFWRKKNKDYHTLPITRDIAKVIQQQQEYIKQRLDENFKYLFCARKANSDKFIPVPKVAGSKILNTAINNLIKNEDIKDENGKLWHFTNHQIRDSTATYLFESGHSFAVVSKWLGHQAAITTQKYIRVKDHTLRDETAKVQACLTNIRGEALNWSDLPETLRSTPNTHTLAVPGDHINTPIYGYCGLPLDEICPHWKACYTCPSFVARREQLLDYIRIQDELRAKQARAEQNGETVKVDQFKQQADNLDAVIASFEKMPA